MPNIETSTEIVKAEVDGAIISVNKASITGNPALAEHARAIHELAKRTREDIIAIGRHLAEARKYVGHGAWLDWIGVEFGWSDQTARRFIRVFELSCDAKFNTLVELDLPLSVLYQLAAPKSEEARQEVAERIEAGEKVTRATVREAIAQARNKIANSFAVDEGPSLAQRQAEYAALFAVPLDSAALKSTGIAGDDDGRNGDGHVGVDARANGRPDKSEAETLIEHWRRDPEKQAEIIQGESTQHLVELMSADQQDELFDRIVRQQIVQASPVPVTKSKQRLLRNLTGTLHWGLGQADHANGAQCLKIIAAKLTVNKHSGKDICFAFAKPTRR